MLQRPHSDARKAITDPASKTSAENMTIDVDLCLCLRTKGLRDILLKHDDPRASSSHVPTWRSEGPTIDGVLVPTDTVVTFVNASRSHEQGMMTVEATTRDASHARPSIERQSPAESNKKLIW